HFHMLSRSNTTSGSPPERCVGDACNSRSRVFGFNAGKIVPCWDNSLCLTSPVITHSDAALINKIKNAVRNWRTVEFYCKKTKKKCHSFRFCWHDKTVVH